MSARLTAEQEREVAFWRALLAEYKRRHALGLLTEWEWVE